MRLNIIKPKLTYTNSAKKKRHTSPPAPLSNPEKYPIKKNKSAKRKLVSGPAIDTSAIPHSCHFRLRLLTGTGLAPPNTGAFSIYNISGTSMDMYGSICLTGLSESLPASLAVRSPSQYATTP